jgi:hypothetical protein
MPCNRQQTYTHPRQIEMCHKDSQADRDRQTKSLTKSVRQTTKTHKTIHKYEYNIHKYNIHIHNIYILYLHRQTDR